MAGFHKAVADAPVGNWYDNGNNVIAFSRGNKGWLAINNEGGATTRTFATGLPAGTYANVAGSGSVTVDSSGNANVTVPAKSAVAIHTGGGTTPGGSVTVYYKTAWASPNIHYGVNGTWTSLPGVAMESACAGWFKKSVDLGTATISGAYGLWRTSLARSLMAEPVATGHASTRSSCPSSAHRVP